MHPTELHVRFHPKLWRPVTCWRFAVGVLELALHEHGRRTNVLRRVYDAVAPTHACPVRERRRLRRALAPLLHNKQTANVARIAALALRVSQRTWSTAPSSGSPGLVAQLFERSHEAWPEKACALYVRAACESVANACLPAGPTNGSMVSVVVMTDAGVRRILAGEDQMRVLLDMGAAVAFVHFGWQRRDNRWIPHQAQSAVRAVVRVGERDAAWIPPWAASFLDANWSSDACRIALEVTAGLPEDVQLALGETARIDPEAAATWIAQLREESAA